jgi:NNP family nitrate/nitrite transporter-like MFS transporter
VEGWDHQLGSVWETMTSQEMPASRSPRTAVTLALATLGLGLNLRASILLGPHLHERFQVGPETYAVLIGLPLLVAALVRLPAGVLTDRYGARVLFPAVSLAAAAAVVGLALADSLPAVVIAGGATGVAGAAFVVGAALVSRTLPYGRRGRALGVFGLGVAIAGALSAMSWGFDPEGRQAALVLGGLLVGFAVLAAVVLRDPVEADRSGSPLRKCAEMIWQASSTSLSLLYVLALGGIVSTAVYLPVYLATAFHFTWFHALAVTAPLVGLAALVRLAGGWWTDRHPTARLLTICYGVAAGLCLVGALAPRTWWLAAPVIAGIAVCDGFASGALLALIGKAARADSVGAVMGATGAAGALGALLPPLLLVGVGGLGRSYSTAWTLLAAVLLAAALYVWKHDLSIGMGLAVRFKPEPSPTAMTVAVVDESDTRLGAAAVVARLAELATSDELLVVYGADERARPRVSALALAAGLRGRLPRHSVVAVPVAQDAGALGRDALLLGEYVDAGALAIAITPTVDVRSVAADLSLYLQADRILMVSYTPAQGAELHQV